MEPMSSLSTVTFPKRHYKKDSRFVNDLYTLTYGDNESLDTVELLSVFNETVSRPRLLTMANQMTAFFFCIYIVI